jgi:hypothetical protein
VKASQPAAGRTLSAKPDVTGGIQTASLKAEVSIICFLEQRFEQSMEA